MLSLKIDYYFYIYTIVKMNQSFKCATKNCSKLNVSVCDECREFLCLACSNTHRTKHIANKTMQDKEWDDMFIDMLKMNEKQYLKKYRYKN